MKEIPERAEIPSSGYMKPSPAVDSCRCASLQIAINFEGGRGEEGKIKPGI